MILQMIGFVNGISRMFCVFILPLLMNLFVGYYFQLHVRLWIDIVSVALLVPLYFVREGRIAWRQNMWKMTAIALILTLITYFAVTEYGLQSWVNPMPFVCALNWLRYIIYHNDESKFRMDLSSVFWLFWMILFLVYVWLVWIIASDLDAEYKQLRQNKSNHQQAQKLSDY